MTDRHDAARKTLEESIGAFLLSIDDKKYAENRERLAKTFGHLFGGTVSVETLDKFRNDVRKKIQ